MPGMPTLQVFALSYLMALRLPRRSSSRTTAKACRQGRSTRSIFGSPETAARTAGREQKADAS